MAFNKILLLLAALSFGINIPIKHVNAKSDVPKHDREGIFWDNKYPTWNGVGLLYESYSCDNDLGFGYTVLDNKQKVKDEDETATKFDAIAFEQIGTLKVGAPRSAQEDAGYEGLQPICKGLSVPFDDLEQIGYTAYFLNENDDFYPSYAYNLFRVPTKQYVVGRDDTLPGSTYKYSEVNGIQYKYVEDINANCHRGPLGTYVAASRYNYGVVSKECVPNDFTKIPGWNQSYEYDPYDSTKPDTRAKGSAPIARDDCVGSGDFKAYFKGYSFGTLYNGNLTTLKRALTRYGPVRVTGTYLKQDSTVTTGQYPGYVNEGYFSIGLVIGWNETALKTIQVFMDSDGTKYNAIGNGIPLKYEWNGETYDIPLFYTIKVFGNSVSVVRAALSVIAAAVVLPALALFF